MPAGVACLSHNITLPRIVRHMFMTPTSVYVVAEVCDRHHQPAKLIPVPTTQDAATNNKVDAEMSSAPASYCVVSLPYSPEDTKRKSINGALSTFV